MSYAIRVMTRGDLDIALAWAREEGWNPGLDDAGAFYAADPSGFLMGWLDGEPIASISVVKYGADFAFLGLYIVRPGHRGKGYGKAIWDAGITSAGDRTIGLDGVVAQQGNYRTSGFVLSHRSARWGGRIAETPASPPGVRRLTASDLPALIAYDAMCFPAPREQFLREWIGSPARTIVGLLSGNHLTGYGAIRPATDGWKIGPLFADDPLDAEALLANLAYVAGDGHIFIDVPEPNLAARAIAVRFRLTPAFETARMYRGPAPKVPLDRAFGTTTLELG